MRSVRLATPGDKAGGRHQTAGATTAPTTSDSAGTPRRWKIGWCCRGWGCGRPSCSMTRRRPSLLIGRRRSAAEVREELQAAYPEAAEDVARDVDRVIADLLRSGAVITAAERRGFRNAVAGLVNDRLEDLVLFDNWICRRPIVAFVLDRLLSLRCQDVRAYIFVATTGRSGTGSLKEIFQQVVDGAVCRHEPWPRLTHDYRSDGTFVPEQYFRRRFLTSKRLVIKSAAAEHGYYVETNHLFKNFADFAIPCFGDRIRIVHLWRDPVRVARSNCRLGAIPGRTGLGRRDLLDPDQPGSVIRLPGLSDESDDLAHDFYRCLWYCYETEPRIRQIRERHPGVRWVSMTTDQLNDRSQLKRMFDQLAVPMDGDRLDRAVGTHANRKLKSSKAPPLDWDECLAMNARLRSCIAE